MEPIVGRTSNQSSENSDRAAEPGGHAPGASDERTRAVPSATGGPEPGWLAAVLRHMPVGVLIAEAPSGNVLLGSERVEQILGAPITAGLSVAEHVAYQGFHADGRPYRPEEWPLARAVQKGLEVIGEEIRVRRGDGTDTMIEVSASAVRDSQRRIVAGVATFRDISERAAIEARLRAQEAELEQEVVARTMEVRELAGHLERVREEEKRALARDLHDDLGSALTALSIHFAILERRLPALSSDPALAEQAAKVRSLLGSITQTTRRIQSDLRPVALDALGLAAALENQVHEFSKRSQIHCEIEVPDQPVVVEPQHAIALVRVLQEALNNISRHAEATRVSVRLGSQREYVVLSVCDNGRGIALERLHSLTTHGLRGMRERAVYLGGSVEIGDNKGGGTCIVVRLPCAATFDSSDSANSSDRSELSDCPDALHTSPPVA